MTLINYIFDWWIGNDIDLGRREQTEMTSSIGSLERNVSSLMNVVLYIVYLLKFDLIL